MKNKRKLTLTGAVGVSLLISLVLIWIDVKWWALPVLVVLSAVAWRVSLLVEGMSSVLITLHRNEGRVRVLDKQRHVELLEILRSTPKGACPAASEGERLPAVEQLIRPGIEGLGGPASTEFGFGLPAGASGITLWLEVGSFDIVAGELAIGVFADGRQLASGAVSSHRPGTHVALGSYLIHDQSQVTTVVSQSAGVTTGLPVSLAFRALVAVVEHPLIPPATVRVAASSFQE